MNAIRYWLRTTFLRNAILVVCLLTPSYSVPDTEIELNRLRALFMVRIFRYVQWPSADKPIFKVGVYNNNKFFKELKEVAEGKDLKGRLVRVVAVETEDSLDDFSALYIDTDNQVKFKQYIDRLKGKSTLVVTQTEGFALMGSGVNFYLESGLLRFEISPSSLSDRNLRASSELLKLARIVGPNE